MKKNAGFTLIEMLVALAIFGMLFSAIFAMLTMGNNAFSTGSTGQDVENQARQGMDHMIRELYETSAGKIVLSNGNSIIVFKVPVGYDPPNILWGAQGAQDSKIKYKIDNNRLIRQILDSTDTLVSERVLAVNAQSLQFSLAGGSMLNITLTCQKRATGGRVLSHSLSSKVTFRN